MRNAIVVLLFLAACSPDGGLLPPERTPDAGVMDATPAEDASDPSGHPDAAGFADATLAPPPDAGGEVADAAVVEPPFTCEGNSAAHQNFNAFWSAFDTQYALFGIRLAGRSWAEIGREACMRVQAGMSDDALFDLLIGMADNLDDGHVNLEAENLNRDEDAWVSVYRYVDEVDDIEDNADENYVDDELELAAEDSIGWATIGDIGFLSITAMDELSASGDEDDDVAAAQAAMTQAIAALGNTRGIIVDVRANPGGWDKVSLEIARWFAGDRALAWSKVYRNGPAHDDFSEWADTFVEASPANAYAGPVVLLTTGATFSAAETFTLAMRMRSNVTIMGEPGSGHFSDQYDGTLPNGWIYDLSGEIYRAADGQIYEMRGVPVDVAVAFDPAALAQGVDTMLDAAIAHLSR